LLILVDGGGNEEAALVATTDASGEGGITEVVAAELVAVGEVELFGAAGAEESDEIVGVVAGPVEGVVIHSAGEAPVAGATLLPLPEPAQAELLSLAPGSLASDLDLAVKGLVDQLRATLDLTSRGLWYWAPWLIAAGCLGVAGEFVRRRLKAQKARRAVPGLVARLWPVTPTP
jgi:hypothetical protein